MTQKLWSIWMEGFLITGSSAKARFIALVEAPTFEKACQQHFMDDSNYSEKDNSVWGCRLYDNESDARKAFG